MHPISALGLGALVCLWLAYRQRRVPTPVHAPFASRPSSHLIWAIGLGSLTLLLGLTGTAIGLSHAFARLLNDSATFSFERTLVVEGRAALLPLLWALHLVIALVLAFLAAGVGERRSLDPSSSRGPCRGPCRSPSLAARAPRSL